ncbi:hypothetical protein O3M35_013015 [Rhynocoris fuscipes]|uniref:EB domain-containing protein n=1 Tax=Rhynocoris fuscipes TaxID=488301 RepID=A0AAW1CJV2_9HEMI
MFTTVLVASVLAVSAQTDYYTDIDQEEDSVLTNETALGEYLGGPCEETCNPDLQNVYCKPETLRCECVKGFPVNVGIYRGCAKPAQIGEQCYYFQTCMYTDQNAECVQINHNAICQCKNGYHPVTVLRPLKRVFCTQDLVVITTDMPTLLGVATGLAIFTALICFVLKLFVGARPRHYANSNLSQPILFAQSGVSVLRGGCTRGSRGVLVPSSRAGAARAAAILLISCHLSPSHGNNRRASVHSSSSSTKSFSARQFERERENRLLAKARERERCEGNSPSPRSTENLIDENMPSESWPKSDDTKDDSSAFTPEVMERGLTISLPHIDDPQPQEEDTISLPAVPTKTSPIANKTTRIINNELEQQ